MQGLVLSLRGADASALVAAIKARLEELKPSLPEGVRLDAFYDRSELIQRAVGTVSKALMEATVLVVVLLVAFLGNLRAALVVAVTLPFAALVTLFDMAWRRPLRALLLGASKAESGKPAIEVLRARSRDSRKPVETPGRVG